MSAELVITPYQGGMVSITFTDRKPEEIYAEPLEHHVRVGDIRIGKVQNVVKNIRCAFLDLGDGITGYYPLEQPNEPIYTKKGASSQIQQGDELLVQIKKDAVKTKALSLTSELSIAGRYLVLIIGSDRIAVSSKLNRDSADRFRELLSSHLSRKQLTDIFERKTGWIVRTGAQQAENAQIIQEAEYLLSYAEKILKIAPYRVSGTCLHQNGADYLNIIKRKTDSDLEKIWTDHEPTFQTIREYLTAFQQEDLPKLKFWQDPLQPLCKKYPVETALDEALRERIWLKSGGYLVIQMTEALTAIDVNTGKYDGKKQSDETFLKINREAAKEAARQIRLRNLSGIIIIDFINMKKKEHQDVLLAELQTFLKKDPIQTILVDMTPLGLVEITRKRTTKTVAEQLHSLKNL